ncbi:MAG TPA: resistance to Congo red protein [Dyella sp.]|nr:resistance to Congo red protein [Dyella sp.]
MKGTTPWRAWMLVAMCLPAFAAGQTTLSPVQVTAPAYTSHHGGYLVSGDFQTNPHIPSVVFPSQALVADDVLSVDPVHLADDDYLVVQECAVADCSQASIVRVWNAGGAASAYQNDENRILIKHENKYWIWVKHFPEPSTLGCATCQYHYYTSFEPFSPPMVLIPSGELAAFNKDALLAARADDPVQVKTQSHEGSTFVVTYEDGSTVRIRRMHADHEAR